MQFKYEIIVIWFCIITLWTVKELTVGGDWSNAISVGSYTSERKRKGRATWEKLQGASKKHERNYKEAEKRQIVVLSTSIKCQGEQKLEPSSFRESDWLAYNVHYIKIWELWEVVGSNGLGPPQVLVKSKWIVSLSGSFFLQQYYNSVPTPLLPFLFQRDTNQLFFSLVCLKRRQ